MLFGNESNGTRWKDEAIVPISKQIFNTFGERLGYRDGGHLTLTTNHPFDIF